ncbi:MAG: glycosyltransferase [Chloroflexota bacterium]
MESSFESKSTTVLLGSDHIKCKPVMSLGHGIVMAHWSNKRPGLAVEAWGALANRWDLRRPLHITGAPEELASRLRARARQLGIGDLLFVHSYLPRAEFLQLFSTAGLLVVTSSIEGFCLPIVEAYRLSVPVVGVRGAGLEEAAGDGAAFAAEVSGDAIAEACARVFLDDAYRGRLVSNGLRRAQALTWSTTALQTREVVLSAITNRRRPAAKID